MDEKTAMARRITAQMNNMILCPICRDNKQEQELCTEGDFEEYLFCPHCDLTIKVEVVLFPRWWDQR